MRCSSRPRSCSSSPTRPPRRAAALTVNGVAASGGAGTTSYDTTGSFTIGTRTDYAETQSGDRRRARHLDAHARERHALGQRLLRATARRRRWSGSAGAEGLATGCYRYTLTGTDNVGNAVSITTTVKVDTSAPVGLGRDGRVGLERERQLRRAARPSTTAPPARAARFDVATVASDGESGLGNATYPALAGGFTPASSGRDRPALPVLAHVHVARDDRDRQRPEDGLRREQRRRRVDAGLPHRLRLDRARRRRAHRQQRRGERRRHHRATTPTARSRSAPAPTTPRRSPPPRPGSAPPPSPARTAPSPPTPARATAAPPRSSARPLRTASPPAATATPSPAPTTSGTRSPSRRS